jgi:hypothetical protein
VQDEKVDERKANLCRRFQHHLFLPFQVLLQRIEEEPAVRDREPGMCVRISLSSWGVEHEGKGTPDVNRRGWTWRGYGVKEKETHQ